jgi:putative membrane protein
MNRTVWIAGAAAGVALVGGCKDTDKDRVTPDTTISGPTAQSGAGKDAEFMRQATVVNNAEVELGKLAQQKGTSPDVQRYGSMLASDHGKNQEKLAQLADMQKVDLPAQLDTEHQQLVTKLSQAQGAQFDRDFIAAMIAGHEKAIAAFEDEVRTGQDSQAKRYAADTLPHLRHHLQFAREIQTRLTSQPMGMPEDRMPANKTHDMQDMPQNPAPPPGDNTGTPR